MNKVIMIGRLTKEPEVRVTQTGKKVASFSIAINEGKSAQGNELVSYFNLNAWERTADIVENYAKKGTKVAVVGRLQNRSWDKPDGTKGYATDIVVSELELLSSRAEETGSYGNNESDTSSAPATKTTKAKKQDGEEEKLPEIDIDSMNVQMPF